MANYAQTNIQLYRQLQEKAYFQDDLLFIHNSYELAAQYFSGRFQRNGKDYIAHLVGTASVLASLSLPREVVALGLLHNVYRTADFGDGQSGVTERRRTRIIQTVGQEVEQMAARFYSFPWSPKVWTDISENPSTLSLLDRTIVILYLADTVEHGLDFGYCYYDVKDAQRYSSPSHSPLLIDIARKLGLPDLAKALDRIYSTNSGVTIPQEFQSAQGRGFTIPKSCRRRSTVICRERFDHFSQKLHGISNGLVDLIYRLLRKVKRMGAS
jgi:predicted RNA-binding protein YlxR (DUF448 family)